MMGKNLMSTCSTYSTAMLAVRGPRHSTQLTAEPSPAVQTRSLSHTHFLSHHTQTLSLSGAHCDEGGGQSGMSRQNAVTFAQWARRQAMEASFSPNRRCHKRCELSGQLGEREGPKDAPLKEALSHKLHNLLHMALWHRRVASACGPISQTSSTCPNPPADHTQ